MNEWINKKATETGRNEPIYPERSIEWLVGKHTSGTPPRGPHTLAYNLSLVALI